MHLRKKILSVVLAGAMIGGELLTGIGSFSLNVSAADSSFAGEEWYDQIATVEENREPAHAYFTPYESAEKALTNEKSVLDVDESESAYKQSLNGTWKFKFAQKPAEREKQVKGADAKNYVENWDTSGWDDIKVPSSIQTIKDADGNFKYEKPIYVNQRYPWQNYENVSLGANVTAPTVNNSVGQYKRTFTVPSDWDGRDVFVSFEGVESAFYLYVNGQRVGYGEDSYTTDEFNITSYLKKGENTIAVEVYRWSTGSYLENQDFIRMSGIFRDVNLYSKAKVEMRDLFVKTDLDKNYKDATLTLDADIRNLGDDTAAGKKYTVSADLYKIDGKTKVWSEPMVIEATVPAAKENVAEKADDKGAHFTGDKKVTNPDKWFADTPNLYMLLVQLKDENGNVVETTVQRVGFREISKADINEAGQEQVQINGEKIMFRGTNRHETDDQDGRAISKEDITTDLKMMKQFNVNAIRTSHYPNNPYMYGLADELGIYICDETNAESHIGATSSNIPSGYPIWNTSVMDRTQNMVERDKNHPSVVIWSLGNEATYQVYNMDENYCFYNSTQWILERDPSRIRKYERDNRYTKGDRKKSMVDIYSSQYWGVDSVKSQVTNTGNKLPYIQSEYAHAMGNALGNFKEYWDIFRNYPNAQGGFIWDWIDQSVSTKVENTTTYTITDLNTGVATKFDGKVTEGRNNTKAIQGTYAATDSAKLATNSTTGITLDVWVKPSENFTKSAQAFISRGDSDGYNLQIDRYGKFEFFVDGWSGGTLSADIPADFTDGNWHRLTATYIGTEYKLYYDGKQLATGQRTNKTTCDASSNPIDITIGASADQSGRTFNGAIDRAAVIKGVMTEEQIQNTNDNLDAVKDNVAYSIDFGSASIKSEGTNYKDSTYFAYGGDWGETVNDNDFCANGILNADRTPSAELYEVKKVHQEVSFYDDGEAANGKVRVVNEFLNTNLNKYNVTWTLKEDNKVIGSGQLSEEQKNIAPQAEATVTLANFPKVSATAGSDYTLTLSVTLKEDAAWAGDYYGHEGDEIAFEEFDLVYTPEKAQPTISASDMDKVNVAESDDAITVTGKTSKTNGKAFEVVIDKAQGYITSYKVDGKTLLENGPVPNYYRAPVSNDPSFSTAMKNAAENFTLDENGITVDKKDKVVNIHVSGSIPEVNTPNSIDYMIYGNGEIVVTNTVTPSASAGNIARIGMKMTVAKDYEKLTYYGNGPQANYVDRNTGAKLGIYNSTVTEQFEKKYVKPQENGNHTGVRWTALTAEDGTGILVSSDSEMESGALHYKAEDLASYRHPYQVPVQENTILTVDLMQRGLGNASCGPAPLSKYIISAGKTYTQTFSILPLTKQTSDEEKMVKSNEDVKSGMPLTGIKVNGKELDNFSDGQNEYTYTLLRGSYEEGKVPQVEVIKKSNDVNVTITQATAVPGTATIKAVSPFGVEKTYTINFKVQDELYVSDMDWTVDQGGYFENTRDACGCGNPMAVYVEGTKQSFDKGVAMHAPAELGVNLEGKGVSRFTARIGISADQTLGNKADVNYVIKGDGKELYRKDHVISNGQSYLVDIDVSKVKDLRLIVEEGDADYNDHALWADAKFTFQSETPDPKPIKVASISVTADKTELTVGDTMQAAAAVLPENADNKEVTWTSSDETVANVSEAGLITAKAAGTATIKATAKDGSGVSGELVITVKAKQVTPDPEPVKVASISVTADKKELEIGGTAQAAAAVLPENADNKEVTWTSSNESAVTVNESGLIKAIGVGSADIIATAKDGSSVTGKVTITVKSKDIDPVPTPTPAPAEKVEELNKAVKEAESFKEADYTAESAGKLKAALAEAKKVLENKDATEAEVNAALKAVSDAKAALVKKDDNDNNNGNNNPAPQVPAVGTTTTVKGVTYKVTKADAVNGTVSAVKLKATKKTKVTIQDTVKVGNYSFKVTTIGKNAFKNNKKLKSIVIGNNVKSIGSNAFSKASRLSSVTFKGTKIVKVGRNAFKGTSSKMKVTVSKKMKSKTLRALKKNLQKAKISKKATYNKVAKVK